MNRLADFTSYVGLVVLAFALLLLAPRVTVGLWAGLSRWLHGCWHAVLTWRPGTVVSTPDLPAVEITVGDRRTGDPDEVIDGAGLPPAHEVLRDLWRLTREFLEGSAVALAVAGLTLRSASAFVTRLPEPAVLAGDLLLVLGAYFVMQRTIRYYPSEWLPALRRAVLPQRVAGRKQDRTGRAKHLLEIAALAPAFLALLAWPTELGRFVADKQFTGPQDTVLVVWACELPWLVAIAWFLARPLLPPLRRAKPTPRHAAPVVRLRPEAQQPMPERQAA